MNEEYFCPLCLHFCSITDDHVTKCCGVEPWMRENLIGNLCERLEGAEDANKDLRDTLEAQLHKIHELEKEVLRLDAIVENYESVEVDNVFCIQQ